MNILKSFFLLFGLNYLFVQPYKTNLQYIPISKTRLLQEKNVKPMLSNNNNNNNNNNNEKIENKLVKPAHI